LSTIAVAASDHAPGWPGTQAWRACTPMDDGGWRRTTSGSSSTAPHTHAGRRRPSICSWDSLRAAGSTAACMHQLARHARAGGRAAGRCAPSCWRGHNRDQLAYVRAGAQSCRRACSAAVQRTGTGRTKTTTETQRGHTGKKICCSRAANQAVCSPSQK
jgi:hypothetical protein